MSEESTERLKGQPSERALRAARLWTDGSEVAARFWAQRLDNYTKDLADENATLRARVEMFEEASNELTEVARKLFASPNIQEQAASLAFAIGKLRYVNEFNGGNDEESGA